MKKIIILLFIFCPILGFFKATFFSDGKECHLHYSKSLAHFQVISYRNRSLSRFVSYDSCIVYKTTGMKTPLSISVDSGGFLEKKPVTKSMEFNDAIFVVDLKGAEAEKAIHQLESFMKLYPFIGEGGGLIGPNNNTFTSYMIRKLKLNRDLPSNSCGKDYIGPGINWMLNTTQGSFIGSIGGYLGVVASKEKFVFELVGLSLGYNWDQQILILPGFGDLNIADIILLLNSKI